MKIITVIFFTGFEVISFSCEMYPSNFVLWPSRTLTRSSRPEDMGACGRGLLPVATKGAVPLPTLRGVVIGVAKSEDKLSRCLLRVSRVLETFLEEREREREREREEREERQLQVSTKENFIGSSKKSLLHRFRSHYAVINAGERRGRMVRK